MTGSRASCLWAWTTATASPATPTGTSTRPASCRGSATAYTNTENEKYEYGLFLADFAITALREGASAALTWCLGDVYYSDLDIHRQRWGLWHYKDEGWEPRPGFYSWSLVTRYTRPGSRVLAVTSSPEAPDIRAVALVSPEGKLTVLVVNRYARAIQATVSPALDRPLSLHRYEYRKDAIPTPDRGMISASGVTTAPAGGTLQLPLPAEAFVVLTELE